MSFYPRLPDELKLMIWKEAIGLEHGGVHHFKIGFDQPRIYKQTLTVYPQRDAWKDDPSSWVDLWGLSVASRLSWDLVNNSEHPDRQLFWQKMSKQELMEAAYMPDLPAVEDRTPQEVMGKGKPNNKWTKPTKAFINGDKDIVCFTVVGSDFDLNWLNWENNHQRFRHLTRVAFNYFNPEVRPNGWITRPFECNCDENCFVEDLPEVCTRAMAQLLRIFENLRSFYFIIPIVASRLVRDLPDHSWMTNKEKKERGIQTVKKTGTQLVTEAMDKFEGLARKKGLSVFQDRKTTYYEVDDSGMELIKNYEDHRDLLNEVEGIWRKDNRLCARHPPRFPWHNPQANWSGVQFKFLVCRGRQPSSGPS